MSDLLEALFVFVLGMVGMMFLLGVTVLPWALGFAYMLGWL